MTDVAPSGTNGSHASESSAGPSGSPVPASGGGSPRRRGSSPGGYASGPKGPPGARVAPTPARTGERLPAFRTFVRGLTWRCPRCGTFRPWSKGWFGRKERCRGCGYRYERHVGFLLGAVTMNTIVTFGLLALVILVGSIATYPDIEVVPILAVAIVVTVCVPILFYPVSYTLWAAVDLLMHPLEAAEVADADAHRQHGP